MYVFQILVCSEKFFGTNQPPNFSVFDGPGGGWLVPNKQVFGTNKDLERVPSVSPRVDAYSAGAVHGACIVGTIARATTPCPRYTHSTGQPYQCGSDAITCFSKARWFRTCFVVHHRSRMVRTLRVAQHMLNCWEPLCRVFSPI